MKKFPGDVFFIPRNVLSPVHDFYNRKMTTNFHNHPETVLTTSCHNLIESIWPIFKLSQLIGIAPVHQTKDSSKKRIPVVLDSLPGFQDCPILTSKWKSVPSIINAYMTFHLICVTCWVLVNIKSLLALSYRGTDLYTFCIQIQLYFVQATVIVVNAFWKRGRLVKLWTLLHNVYKCLNSFKEDNSGLIRNDCSGQDTLILTQYLKRLKWISYIVVVIVLILGCSYSVFFVYFALSQCYLTDEGLTALKNSKGPVCFLDDWPILIEKITYTVVEIYHQGVALMFAGACLIIWAMHKEIGKRLKRVLKVTVGIRSGEIEKLRISHEKLMKSGKILSDFFGIAILAASVLSVVSVTSAIYTVVLGVTEMGMTGVVSTVYLNNYIILWVYHGVFGILALIFILVPGQMIQNAAEIPFQIIGSVPHEDLDESVKYQITAFMQQKRNFLGITACNISVIGLSFLATAATNVTTYILVLVQFRLGADKE